MKEQQENEVEGEEEDADAIDAGFDAECAESAVAAIVDDDELDDMTPVGGEIVVIGVIVAVVGIASASLGWIELGAAALSFVGRVLFLAASSLC